MDTWVIVLVAVLLAAPVVLGLIGWRQPATFTFARTTRLAAPADRVWAAIVNREAEPSWRSFVDRVERLGVPTSDSESSGQDHPEDRDGNAEVDPTLYLRPAPTGSAAPADTPTPAAVGASPDPQVVSVYREHYAGGRGYMTLADRVVEPGRVLRRTMRDRGRPRAEASLTLSIAALPGDPAAATVVTVVETGTILSATHRGLHLAFGKTRYVDRYLHDLAAHIGCRAAISSVDPPPGPDASGDNHAA